MLSPYLNNGLLMPADVCDAVQWSYDNGRVPIASAEGFIRQVIGWREYVHGLYWLWMPGYMDKNELGAHRALPAAFTDPSSTNMRCVSVCAGDVKQRGWAHHIQRLMVLGNLALIAGVEPRALNDWMWESFVDGAEWVMVPNVIGMTLHADGGMMATKPYAAGGSKHHPAAKRRTACIPPRSCQSSPRCLRTEFCNRAPLESSIAGQ